MGVLCSEYLRIYFDIQNFESKMNAKQMTFLMGYVSFGCFFCFYCLLVVWNKVKYNEKLNIKVKYNENSKQQGFIKTKITY